MAASADPPVAAVARPPQSKYWMVTVNNPKQEAQWDEVPSIKYAKWQLEKGENDTPHIQAYLEFDKRQRLTAVIKAVKKANGDLHGHCEMRKGTQQQAVDYVSKEDTRIDGPWEHGERAVLKQGQRTDLINLRDAIKEKRKWTDILDDEANAPTLIKYHKAASFMRSVYELEAQPAWRNLEVIVLYGATGTGKTRRAVADGAYLWNPSTTEWWDGYEGQEVICIDEFYGQMPIARMLRILDGYHCRLPLKGSFTWALWSKVYITSNTHPDNWYGEGSGVPAQAKAALMRRITKIEEMF